MSGHPPATVRARALRPGDVVAVVAPSGSAAGLFPGRFRRGLDALERLGLRARPTSHATSVGRWTSASIESRVDDLHEAFADDEVAGVLCAIGGRGAAQLLSHLDYDLIARNPKVFCGYSDVTALHTAIRLRTGLVTFYGPSLMAEFGEHPAPLTETAECFLAMTARASSYGPVAPFDRIVRGTTDWSTAVEREIHPAPTRRVLRGGRASGLLAGGCLPVLCELLGTPWQPDWAGCIVLLETPQYPYTTDTALTDLWHLRNAGLLDGVAGLVVGWPYAVDADDELAECVASVTADRDHPVLYGAAVGHTDPMVTWPLGVRASLEDDRLEIDEPAVLDPYHQRMPKEVEDESWTA